MPCPICTGQYLSNDFSVIEKEGKRVILQGVIYAVISPHKAHYRPFSNYFTVSLYPEKGKVKYLKFGTKDEIEKWNFIREKRIRCEGCLHRVDDKELVFDIANVKFL